MPQAEKLTDEYLRELEMEAKNLKYLHPTDTLELLREIKRLKKMLNSPVNATPNTGMNLNGSSK